MVPALSLCSLHLLTSQAPSCSSPRSSAMPSLSHPASPFPPQHPPQGSSGGPNTVCAVSVLLSQYFLVCSHPVSVWSALMPTSQNGTHLLSVSGPFARRSPKRGPSQQSPEGVGEVLFFY